MPLSSPVVVQRPALGWRILVAVILATALALPLAGLLIFRPRAEADARRQINLALRTRVDARIATLGRWADDALKDARMVASDPSVLELVRGNGRSGAVFYGRASPSNEVHLIDALQPYVTIKGYGQVLVVQHGQIVARAANRPASPVCTIFPPGGSATGFGLHEHNDGRKWVTFAARARGPFAGDPFVILEQPATDYLYPLLSRSSMGLQSAESYLLSDEGARFRYLSPLKFAGPRLFATIAADSVEASALRQRAEQSLDEPMADYRGVPTLSVIRRLSGSPWLLVMKVDDAEALAAPRRVIRTTVFAWSALGLSAALAGAALLLWQRRRLADAAARMQQRTSTILDHANDPILFVSPEGRVVHANRRADEFYGYAPGALLGRSIVEDLGTAEDRALLRERLDAAASTGELVAATNHRRADGSVAPVELSIRRITFDDETVLVTVVRDLSARRGVEQALRRSESLFRAVFQQSPIGIIIGTLDGRITRANPAVERMLGYSAAELTTMSLRDVTAPEDRERDEPLLESTAAERSGYRREKRYLHKDGHITLGELTVTFVRDETGEPAFALALVQDITDRRALQEQLLQSQKMESIGRLAGGVAHDFNNLLTAILGYAEVLSEELPTGHQARPFVVEIQRAGTRAATLTAQLLAFARRQVVARRVLDLNEVVEQSGRMLHGLLGDDVQIETRLAGKLWSVNADPTQMQQVILNMAVNARDAMPTGGRLTIETSNETLSAQSPVDALSGDFVRLSVSDTGEGMSPDVAAHVFEPFFTTKEQGKGTGLGLATCHGIVTQNGGEIRVASRLGAGTTFHVYLPRDQTIVMTSGAGPVEPAIDGRGRLVLVAEDETPVRNLAMRSLTRRGFRVLEARDGGEALRLAEEHADEIDLLLTDVTMPVLGGPELARRFRQLCPRAKVLFMSGHAESGIAHQGVLEPGVAFVAKPFTPDQIAKSVRDVLDGVI
jgi:two-component system cell cycle sensor histidine kinase/response regulator CckA